MRIEIQNKWLTTDEIEDLRMDLSIFFNTDLIYFSSDGNKTIFVDDEK